MCLANLWILCHSMSMEFLAWPWMELFFGSQAINTVYPPPWLNLLTIWFLMDHFQHEHPEMTSSWAPCDMASFGASICAKQYEADSFLDRGGFWFRQGFCQPHSTTSTIPWLQVCAFQFTETKPDWRWLFVYSIFVGQVDQSFTPRSWQKLILNHHLNQVAT